VVLWVVDCLGSLTAQSGRWLGGGVGGVDMASGGKIVCVWDATNCWASVSCFELDGFGLILLLFKNATSD
jgi:hypothetical protein